MYLKQYADLTDSMIRQYMGSYGDTLLQYRGDSSYMRYSIDTFVVDSASQEYTYDTTITYTDSLNLHGYPDSVNLVLDNAKYFYNYKIMRAKIYAGNNDIGNALTLLHAIPGNYTLSQQELNDLNNIIYLFGVEDSLHKHGNAWTH